MSGRLAFRVTRVPDPDAVYSEIQVGRVLSILPADEDAEPTRVDWRLFYSALHSPRRDRVAELLRGGCENERLS